MCGIIGIVGNQPVAQRLVDGLKRMEYRGYDSAGLCTLDGGYLAKISSMVTAITSRGMGEAEMDRVAELIARALSTPDDDAALGRVKVEVEALCRKFPLYPEA